MERDCGAWINLLSHKVKKRLNATLADLGITGVQSRIMHYILAHYEDGPVFQKDVEEAFGLSRSTATGILQLLEKNGIIVRESVESDGRLKSLVPTRKAVELESEVRTSVREIEQLMTQGISSGQLELFYETVTKMSANLDA